VSYVALARKWRPKKFSEMIGQEHVRVALTNALNADRVHHAFLFTGTRGVGKTTIARILAKCLNCEKGVSAEPCGVCSACVEIDGGRFPDLLEVDAASRTKVDDTRELLDNVQYAPTRGRYKVYLIDEVHMLSTHSFNALLKTLEEPPPRVKFLLATTDPQKLPVTVLSRCLQFNLKRLPVGLIADRIRQILDAEGIEHEPAAIRLVAQAADGSVRDGLSLLDQLIAFGGGKVSEVEARAMLGTISRDHVVRLVERLVSEDPRELVIAARGLEEFAPDYSQVLDELASLFAHIALKQVVPDFEGDELYDPALLERFAKQFAPEDIQLYYQTAIIGRRDLQLAPDPRTGFEMTLLRMLAFRPASGESLQPASSSPSAASNAGAPAQRSGAAAAKAAALGGDRPKPTSAALNNGPLHGASTGARSAAPQSTADVRVSANADEASATNVVNSARAASAVGMQGMNAASDASSPQRATAGDGATRLQSANAGSEASNERSAKADGGVAGGGMRSAPVTGGATSSEVGGATASGRGHSLPDSGEGSWASILTQLDLQGAARQLASHCAWLGRQGSLIRLALDPRTKIVRTPSQQEKLAQALSKYFGEPLRVEIDMVETAIETPAQAEQRASSEELDAARRAFDEDPTVRAFKERFGATLLPDTVRPAK
jgi:DNA polymerase III subunit gamma/tau